MSDKWTKENIIRLIELYEIEKCLWDTIWSLFLHNTVEKKRRIKVWNVK